MNKHLHTKDCPVRQRGFQTPYSNGDFDACTCKAFGSPEQRLMQAFDMACEAPPCLTLQSAIVEVQRKAETVGLTEVEMSCWATRLAELAFEAEQ